METIYRDQPLATNTLTLRLSFKLTSVNVPSNGTRTNADCLRGHISRHPSRLSGHVRAICLRVSACVVLTHTRDTRPLGAWPKALRSNPRSTWKLQRLVELPKFSAIT